MLTCGIKMSTIILFFIVLLKTSYAEILSLNSTEYARMPPIYRLDPYESCVSKPGGQYCFVRFTLVSDTHSRLLDLIQEYSSFTNVNFNHSYLHYGICTHRCKNNITGIKEKVETCLNSSIWDEYELKTNVNDLMCHTKDEKSPIETGDLVVAAVILAIAAFNVIGSLADLWISKHFKGSRLLQCFSIRRNWRRLVKPVESEEPRVRRLRGLDGMRAMSTSIVIMSHAILPALIYVDNTMVVEDLYKHVENHVVSSGYLIMQTFFIMSGFLLVYTLQMKAETTRTSWGTLPRRIALRWLRITPAYALVLAVTATWMRHAGSGPMWQPIVNPEVRDCARYWWHHLLYINNYFDNSECMIQTWYLPADFHLYILGVITFVACKTTRAKTIALSLLFTIGLITPAFETYLQDLDGPLIFTPETIRSMFKVNPTFNKAYKRSHTNISCYVLGLALGYIVYHLQNSDFDIQKYNKYRLLTWLPLPIIIGVEMSATIFYEDRRSMTSRLLYAAFIKPVFGFLLCCIMLTIILKFKTAYRHILEWRWWTCPARVSYSAFLLHGALVRYAAGVQTRLGHSSKFQMAQLFLVFVFAAYVAGFIYWIVVEAPMDQIVKTYFDSPKKSKKKDTTALDKKEKTTV